MATPHASIAILLSQLQALNDVIILTFVNTMSLFPRVGVAGVAGVAVALLRLVREVGAGVEKVDRREGIGRGGGSIATLKQGVTIEAWWQRGHLNRPPKSITHCASQIWSRIWRLTERSTHLLIQLSHGGSRH